MTLKLISSVNPKLKTKSAPYEEKDFEKAIKLGKKMLAFLNKHPHSVGLSAVQVGILKQVFVVRYRGVKKIIINPVITFYSPQKDSMEEGCLSFPNENRVIKRSVGIKMSYYDGFTKSPVIEKEATGMMARIMQHEYDHLNGVTCIK